MGALRSRRKMIVTKQDNNDDEKEEFNALKTTQDSFIRYLEIPISSIWSTPRITVGRLPTL